MNFQKGNANYQMKILLCCEHFYPATGGVQKMLEEIGVRLDSFGHEVTIATSFHPERKSFSHRNLKIKSFKISGNLINGINGDREEYQNFLLNSDFDCLLVMAAQQWSLDLMLPILKDIKYKKIHIPCGYSNFYKKSHEKYYQDMKSYLPEFDSLIYNSTDYRDINFARELSLNEKINVIPAGASEFEFLEKPEINIRKELNISKNRFVFLTVGSPPFNKGHKEVVEAFELCDFPEPITVILNGDYSNSHFGKGIKGLIKKLVFPFLGRDAKSIQKISSGKHDIRFTNLERSKLISLFFEADLFIFASKIEYSALVLYEALAAGLPFLSVPVGNSDEVADWSNAGIICEAKKNEEGFVVVDPQVLADKIKSVYKNREDLEALGKNGRKAWEDRFNWGVISKKIEELMI